LKKNPGKIVLRTVLILIFVFSFIRLLNLTIEFSKESIQMDFTAYYAAGKALNNGLSPYENHVLDRWDLWDGINMFKHSRFLYPPLVANMFQPLATLPYNQAKYIWNFFNLTCLIICFIVLIKIFGYNKDLNKILITGILTFNFFPFITLLERGQIDCITFLLIVLGLMFLMKKEKYYFVSGLFLGIAALFKPYSLLLIPFLFIRKKYKVLYGYASGIILIIILTLSISGYDAAHNYITSEFPRISKYHSSGTQEMRIPVEIIQTYLPMTPYSISIIDGRMYLTESISFNSKASFIRILQVLQSKTPLNFSNTTYSVIVFAVFLVLMLILFKRTFNTETPLTEFIYWQIVLLTILLSSPYTWIMNLVWLIPVAFIIIKIFPQLLNDKRFTTLVLLAVGYLLLALPDNLLLTKNLPILGEFFKIRYVVSEFLILISLIFYIKSNKPAIEGVLKA